MSPAEPHARDMSQRGVVAPSRAAYVPAQAAAFQKDGASEMVEGECSPCVGLAVHACLQTHSEVLRRPGSAAVCPRKKRTEERIGTAIVAVHVRHARREEERNA